MNTDQLLEGLTPPQREAVTHVDGPLLVLAAAGSGKTRVTTRRAAYLATEATRPEHVLAITFTNKAAKEMRERITSLGVGRGMVVCTFHSLCARLLRQYAEPLGLDRNFTIFDESDRKKVVRLAIGQCNLAETNWPVARVQGWISRAKNDFQTPDEMANSAQDFAVRTMARVYEKYEKLLTEQNGLDFDDLLFKVAGMLKHKPDLRAELEQRFKYVLIDEYQDTNLSQYVIARGLTLERSNLCATGDPDQSIYGWRGANLRNILDFEKDYPAVKTVRLEQNYRSTQRILAAAGELIRRNQQRKDKALWTENDEGVPVRVVTCDDGRAEARWIAGQIAEERAAGRSFGDCAIFYRTNSMTRLLEETLLRATIPYQIARGVEFYNRKEIKDVLAYLRVLVNPADAVSLLRIINTPARGIGKTTVERMGLLARARSVSLMDFLRSADQVTELGRSAGKVRRFVDLLASLKPRDDQPVAETVRAVFGGSGMEGEYERAGEAGEDAIENVNELISSAGDYDAQNPEGSLVEWLQQISLVSDVDAVEAGAGAVTLMTLHAAKGLEFPVVFVIGLEEGVLPHERSLRDEDQMEEERRLCFVGMTRAQERLTLTHATYRTTRGTTLRTVRSPFLRELGEGVEHIGQSEPTIDDRDTNDDHSQIGEFSDFDDGDLVRHPKFGVGRLLWIAPEPGRTRAGVKFRGIGEKTLILEFAKLERVEMRE